jgi:glycosyltransferase involved in cell wall biosynthesis
VFDTALIITTYNRPDALDRVLLSTMQQQTKPDQVIIADDGSTDDTSQLIQSWRSRLPLVHAWQPDQGFRAARARNLAIEQANAEHLILIDGDCLMPPNFVAAHRRLI